MNDAGPLTVWGSSCSYFTGKLEGYLRYKELPYRLRPMTAEYFKTIVPAKTGAKQMPAVELADGRWMTDTTPMIGWFEEQYPRHPILPGDAVQDFVCHLIEDYADEWLWRPAMHYRWSYPQGRQFRGTYLTDELLADLRGPTFIKRWNIRHRQFTHFVKNDGVTPQTRAHVEHGYLHLLALLEPVFRSRPFLFGNRPTLADIGLFGPLFRHFALDPEPSEIMREQAPAVYEWVARLWNAQGSRTDQTLLTGIPDDLLPLLSEIGQTHLPHLAANARAWLAGQKTFEVTLQGTRYRDVPTSRYRAWCLEELQAASRALDAEAETSLRQLLEAQGCWTPLWEVPEPRSQYNRNGQAPFGTGLAVYNLGGAGGL